MNNTTVKCGDHIIRKAIRDSRNHLFIPISQLPDSDSSIISDREGYRYTRVIVPQGYFLYERI